MFDKVLVPLDGSALSEAVLPWVRRLGTTSESPKIYLVRVVTPLHPLAAYEGYASIEAPAVDLATLAAEARGYLHRIAAQVGPQADAHPLVHTGEAGREIVAAARACGADLIAMSTHGRTGLGRLVLGSVADYVVRHSGRPVLLVRPDAGALRAAPAAAAAAQP